MRCVMIMVLLCGLSLTGCSLFSSKHEKAPTAAKVQTKKAPSKVEVTADTSLVGKVKSVNAKARFAVLSFPIGKMPAIEQRMSIYRNGLKAGEVKITGPQMDTNIAADVLSGDAAIGDEVREN